MMLIASWFANHAPYDGLARAGCQVAALTAPLAFVLLVGPGCIAWLRERCGEPIRTASKDLNALLASKQATPTVGGVLFLTPFLAVCAVAVATPVLTIVVLTALGFGLLGLYDDAIKLRTSRRGMRALHKLLVQIALAVGIAWLLWHLETQDDAVVRRAAPLVGTFTLGAWACPLFALLIVAWSNAINLTDGLDGLAAGCSAWLLTGLVAASLVVNTGADQGAMIATLALLGAVLGFGWFNRHPARVFMGNTGSSALGALVAVLGVMLRLEWMLLLAGAVFVAETLSVVLQVGYFKWSGRRLLRCAPLHHHFQFLGWTEPAIVRGFWLASAVCTALAVTLSILSTADHPSGGLAAQVNGKKLSQEATRQREIP